MTAQPMVVGLSYRTAPMRLLERAAVSAQGRAELTAALCAGNNVTEAVVLSTCNRLEVYAAVDRFHGGLADIGAALAQQCGLSLEELSPYLYVHYEASAVEHIFSVASGLDSMAVGETQILGQVREALREGQDASSVARVLIPLLQQTLRVGKRVHTETGLTQAGTSLVAAALDQASQVLGDLRDRSVLVLGAGAMGGLAVAGVQRVGVGCLTVLSRTLERAERMAAAAGGQAVAADQLTQALAQADVVLACTGAVGHLVDAPTAKAAAAQRDGAPQVYLDLALPRDIDPLVAELDSVSVIDLERLGEILADHPMGEEIVLARNMVAQELGEYLVGLEVQQVAPTVVALRLMARDIVDAEVDRLRSRLNTDLDPRVLSEVEQTVHRVVEKLLHTPTVRVKELAVQPNGSAYASALRELFDLNLDLPAAVTAPGVGTATGGR